VTLGQLVDGLDPEILYRWRARVLYAPYSVTQPGITAPANPAHGPWRRAAAQADEADIRTTFPECSDGSDNDGDGQTDYPADAGCRDSTWGFENPACNDGVDNDSDSLIDMADADCGNPWSDNELSRGCGLLGIELLPLLIGLEARRRVRRSRTR
jgi:hypothetical protein